MKLEGKQKRLQSVDNQYSIELKTLREQLAQEEANVTALREELATKDQHLRKLRTSVRDVSFCL